MKQKKLAIFIFLITLVTPVLAACGQQPKVPAAEADLAAQTETVPVANGGSYTDVSADGLAAILEDKDFPLINVHIPYEGEIEGTDEFIPFDEIEQNLNKLPADKDARIVVYCRSGSMSTQAASTLVKRGYTDVWNLDGGMVDWEEAGFEIEK